MRPAMEEQFSLFTVEALCFAYGSNTALKDVSFTVSAGESIAILGANGSGKSTLLKIMDGLMYPASGSVSFLGERITEERLQGSFLKSFRERVSFVFPEPDVQLFCPTVLEELMFGPLQLGLKEAEAVKRAEELLKMLDIEAITKRPPYTLSSGEKKKVAIASVLAINPDVLLLDEPTNGLDPRAQVWLFELLERLKELKKTIILATHDLSLAGDLCERVMVLDEAHSLVADGPTEQVLKDKDLLLAANIIHEHAHRHGHIIHRHSHGPYSTHDEHE